ncbi:MAG: FAD-binding protein [Candidatus Abyssobacteria bacterium SURF_17]|uniref:FAD-binding protein n=1 Tax=Candidatus Abyssobacteria bacterium SURF_17 TaxID=2093361 RepID=A0A419EWM0_9BACT|nr:MAG: FAD-binding protein [Candidatus Abyssubacteria bacterium SURF_17]
MELANRVVMPPMGTGLGNDDATVSEALLAYIRRQAKSGAGLVVSEITAVHPSGSVSPTHLGAYDDRFIPGLRKYAGAVHEAGGKAAMQLHHGGRESFFLLMQGEAIGPSAIPSVVYRQPPREMTLKEIHEIIDSFGRAARRAREAGFDAVEVHGAHGYLLTQFLSALSNQRQDEYGGSFDNRARFVIEVLEAVRKSVGNDFPISLRLSAEECIKGGYTVEDIQTILPRLVNAGADIIHASLGTHGTPAGITSAPAEYEPGFNVWRAKKIKEVISVPVITVGRFTDPALADEVIARGEADMVAFGRQQLADPDYLIKAKEGRTNDIRICIACNQGCIERLMLEPGSSVRCAINPETGQELIYPRTLASTRRKVWVIGGGPAGLTAAYEAARIGHTVSLFEKEEKAGGQIFYASKAPYKEVYDAWIQWLIFQVQAIGVEVKTHTLVTETMLDEEQPEAVILATGAEKIIPPIPGIDLPLVCDAFQILGDEVKPLRNVVIIGGGMIGMETADFLIDKGCAVTVVELLPRSPVKKFASHGYMLHKRLRDGGGRLLLGTEVVAIREDSVVVVSEERGEEVLPAEQVVIAVGTRPRNELKEALSERNIRHFVVGDASGPRRIIEATEEGARAAWDI